MGVHYQEFEIGEGDEAVKYTVNQFTATAAVKMFARLAKVLGGPFSTLVKSMDKGIEEALPEAVGLLVQELEPDAFDKLIKDLLSCVMVRGAPLKDTFDIHFQGRFGSSHAACRTRYPISVQRFFSRDRQSGRGSSQKSSGVQVKVPEHLEWMIWRPVISRIVSLTELDTHYSLYDLLDLHDAMDLQELAEAKAREAAEKAAKKG